MILILSELQDQHLDGVEAEGDEVHQRIRHDSEVDAEQEALVGKTYGTEQIRQDIDRGKQSGDAEEDHGALEI